MVYSPVKKMNGIGALIGALRLAARESVLGLGRVEVREVSRNQSPGLARAHQPVGVVLVNGFAGCERLNFHAPQRAAETRLIQVRVQLGTEFAERAGEVCRLGSGRRGGNQNGQGAAKQNEIPKPWRVAKPGFHLRPHSGSVAGRQKTRNR